MMKSKFTESQIVGILGEGEVGRYPHRNAVLGRRSTPQEQAFLLEPGSSF